MEQFAKEALPVSLEAEMRHSYLDYAMSVIVGRALPDVRDGLKPVHRRILFAMHEANNVWNRPYVKCARVVGDVLGRSEEHTSELQSLTNLVCRLLLEKKKTTRTGTVSRLFSGTCRMGFILGIPGAPGPALYCNGPARLSPNPLKLATAARRLTTCTPH